MTSRQLVAVLIRLFALWMVVSSIQSLLVIFVIPDEVSLIAYFAYAVVYAVLAAFLWFFPLTIAGHILRTSSQDASVGITPNGLIHAAIIAAGLILLVLSVPDMLNNVAFALSNQLRDFPGQISRTDYVVRLGTPLLQIAMSLVMVLRAPWLAEKIRPHEVVVNSNNSLERSRDG